MGLAIPELPRSIRASALMHGSNADFVINAYLALQRQWPDAGGYHHYLFLLGQPQCSRVAVLREIAASDNARRCGVEFIDDLPQEHEFRPEDHDRSRLAEISQRAAGAGAPAARAGVPTLPAGAVDLIAEPAHRSRDNRGPAQGLPWHTTCF